MYVYQANLMAHSHRALAFPPSDGVFYVFSNLFTQNISVSGNTTAAKWMSSVPNLALPLTLTLCVNGT